jgi:diguanylate cyclase (GGDEF)-like protein
MIRKKYFDILSEINIDSGVNYIFTAIENNMHLNIDLKIKIHTDPKKVPGNLYAFLKLSLKYNILNILCIEETKKDDAQLIIFYFQNKSLTLNSDMLKRPANEILAYMMKKIDQSIGSFLSYILLKAASLADVFYASNVIINESSKKDVSVDKLIFSILTGITSTFSGKFNRAILFKRAGNYYNVYRALSGETNSNSEKILKDIKNKSYKLINIIDSFEEKEFFCSYEEKIQNVKISEYTLLSNPLILESFDLNKAIKIPKSFMVKELCDQFDIKGELAIMPMKFEGRVFGFLMCDNNYDFKPISDEQVEILDYLGRQGAMLWENKISMQALRFEAETDPLTNFGNRNSYEKYIEKLSISNEKNIGIVMIDLDDFKKINDEKGHKEGDEIIKIFSNSTRKFIRSTDKVFRYGGDEFILFFNNITSEILEEIINKIQEESNKYNCYFSAGGIIKIDEDIFKAIRKADELSYISKKLGGKRLTLS